jgi:bacteriocin-like protein
MSTDTETTDTPREPTYVELTEKDLNNVVGGVGLGLRKSAGNQASGVMFLAFTFKL